MAKLLILGWRGLEKIYEAEMKPGTLSEPEIRCLLERLCCRHLSADAILAASLRRNHKFHVEHLRFEKETSAEFWSISVSSHPYHYDAVVRFDPDTVARLRRTLDEQQ